MRNTTSLTARERRNPPSRRKSCTACIKSKRRCDGATPSCLRCGQRGIACDYPLRKARGATLTKEGGDSALKDVEEDAGLGSFDFLDEFTADDVALEGLECPPPLDLCLDPATLSLELVRQPMTVMAPSAVPQLAGSVASERVKRHLQFALDETKRALYTMAKDMETPWSHAMLYQDDMPKSIRDVHASCAMYSMKNRFNGPVIMRSIESYAEELLAAETPPTLRDRLAHTQALTLYHIIRLLDGDIRARATAERQVLTLEDSAFALLPHIDFDGILPGVGDVLPLYPIAHARSVWRDWVVQESARRTFLFSLYFLQAYRIVSGLQPADCDQRLMLCRALTVSKRLWTAKSPVAFAQAWNQGRFLVITDCSFDIILRQERADDIDAFAKMLLSSAMGVEEAEGWFASRGSSLRDA